MANSEHGKFSISAFHLTVPASLLLTPPSEESYMYGLCILLSDVSWQRIQYNTIQYNTQRYAKPSTFSTDRTTPLRLHIVKAGYHSTADTYLSLQNKWPNCTGPTTSTLHTDDITHDISTRNCHVPPPKPLGLGKDKKSRVVREQFKKKKPPLVRYGLRWREGFCSLKQGDSTESRRRAARSPVSCNDSPGLISRPTDRLPQL